MICNTCSNLNSSLSSPAFLRRPPCSQLLGAGSVASCEGLVGVVCSLDPAVTQHTPPSCSLCLVRMSACCSSRRRARQTLRFEKGLYFFLRPRAAWKSSLLVVRLQWRGLYSNRDNLCLEDWRKHAATTCPLTTHTSDTHTRRGAAETRRAVLS